MFVRTSPVSHDTIVETPAISSQSRFECCVFSESFHLSILVLQVVDAAAVHPTFLRPSLPRLLWSQVLAESKAFAERTIPTLDLVSFGKLCGDVTSLEKLADDSTYSEDQQKSIRDLTKMLASCSDEDSLFEEDANSKAKFLQYIREVSTWFKDFRPPVERSFSHWEPCSHQASWSWKASPTSRSASRQVL